MRRLRACLPAAGFAAVVLLLLGDVLLSRSVILSAAGEDLVDYYVGMRHFGFSQLKQGNLAQWNPYLFSGIPYFANFESALLYPLNWPYLVLPMARAINLGIALHLFMAGYFTFLWRRYREASETAAFLSGLLFMLSGPYFLHVYPGHLSNLCVMAWTPLLFLALDGWFGSGEARWGLLGTFVISMQILAGHPQYVYYTAMGAVVYSGLRLYRHPRVLALGLGAAAMYAGSALLTAVQLLTGLQSVTEMSRGSGAQYDFSRTFALAPENLLTLFLPSAFGDILTMPYYGRWHMWEGCLFMGVAGLVLACLGAAERDKEGRRTELAMALTFVVLALGVYTPLYDVLYVYLPGYGLFRGTSKFIYLTALFLAALAGTGFDRLLARRRPPLRAVMLIAGALGAAMTGLWAWLSVPKDLGQLAAWQALFQALGSSEETFFPIHLFHSMAAVTAAVEFAAGEFLACGRMLLLVSVLLYLIGVSRRWAYGLAALAALELFLFAHHFKVTSRLEQEYPSAWAAAVKSASGDFRVLHIGMPRQNPLLASGVQDVWGYGPLYMSRYARMMEFVWRLTTGGRDIDPKRMLIENPILALFRCRYIFLNDPKKTILTVPEMPRAQLLDDWTLMTEPDKIFKTLMDPAFDARKTVVLEKAPDPLPEKKPGSPGRASVLRSGTDWLEIEAELSRPAVLLVTDSYGASWRVRPLSTGAQARYEIMPADWSLRAVPLAAGKHRLLMEYRPSAFELGKWISAAALLAFAVLCARFLWRRSA